MKIRIIKSVMPLFLAIAYFTAIFAQEASPPPAGESAKDMEVESSEDTEVESMLNDLTIEEKVAQLFFITPEALTGVDGVTVAGSRTAECFAEYPVGGIVYFSQNLISREQISSMLTGMQDISMNRINLPVFLAVDEEGGPVTRVSGCGIEGVPEIGDMFSVGKTGDVQQAYQTGAEIGTYLSELHFNVDFAPVADVYTNEANPVIRRRAFGTDAGTVSQMVPMAVRGLMDAGVEATLKHFPGHGDTAVDSHAGYACSSKSLDELRSCELLPFKAGIEAGASFVMAGHISVPNVPGCDTPASLSHTMLTEILRNELGFQKIIITDALNMGAISNYYTSGQAAVQAILAGADMLLMPSDFQSAYAEVCAAVYDGRITEERLNESVRRILKEKMRLM